jgi:hypothetical protein
LTPLSSTKWAPLAHRSPQRYHSPAQCVSRCVSPVCICPASDVDVCNYSSLSTHRPAIITVPLLRLLTYRTLAHTVRWISHILTLYGTTVLPSAHTARWIPRIFSLYGTHILPSTRHLKLLCTCKCRILYFLSLP